MLFSEVSGLVLGLDIVGRLSLRFFRGLDGNFNFVLSFWGILFEVDK